MPENVNRSFLPVPSQTSATLLIPLLEPFINLLLFFDILVQSFSVSVFERDYDIQVKFHLMRVCLGAVTLCFCTAQKYCPVFSPTFLHLR